MVLPQEVQRKVSSIENLATLPNIATEILEMIRKSNSNMREIARVIEKDVSVTTKILKVSNSPLWGFAGRIDNVNRALVILGLKQVTNIVVAVSLYSAFTKLKPNPYFNREKFWLHSAATGQISRTLSKKLKLNFHGEDFVAALIHDIGKFILDQFLSEQFKYTLEYAQNSGKKIVDAEKEVLGCDHAEIGAWLLQRWNFPEAISTAVLFHHHPEKAPQHRDLTSVIHISDMLCEMWGIGFDEDTTKFYLKENPGWNILRNTHPHLYKMDVEKFTFQLKSDIDKARLFIQLIGE